MQTHHIALVPEAGGVSPAELLRVAAALQKQVASQFGPLWDVQASVDPFLELEEVPAGYIPVVVSMPDRIDHEVRLQVDENGQPFARVRLGPTWSIQASRACLELLINPYGRRTLSAPSPRSDQGPVDLLIEVSAAFGACPVAYAVNDVAVADFCTPTYFRAATSAHHGAERYSYCGSLAVPMQLLRGGRLAWFDAISNSWWLRSAHASQADDLALGPLHRTQSPRDLIEQHVLGLGLPQPPADTLYSRVRWRFLCEQAQAASRARGQRLRERLVVDAASEHAAGLQVESQPPIPAREWESQRNTLQSFPPPPLPLPIVPKRAATEQPTFSVDQNYANEALHAARADAVSTADKTPVFGSMPDGKPVENGAKVKSVTPSLAPVAMLERRSERKGPHFGVIAAAALLLGAGVQLLTRDGAAASTEAAPYKTHPSAAHASTVRQPAGNAAAQPPAPVAAPHAAAPAVTVSSPVAVPAPEPASSATAQVDRTHGRRTADAGRAQPATAARTRRREAAQELSSSSEDGRAIHAASHAHPHASEDARAEALTARADEATRTAPPLPPSIEDLIDSRR